MTLVVFCFEVHQPFRLKHFPGSSDGLKDEELIEHFLNNSLNKFVFDRAARKCYYPTIQILLESIDTFKKQKRKFKVAFNISGVWLEQCEKWQPDLLDLFKQLAETKLVEFLGSTYFHSLASLFATHEEFIEQIKMQNEAIKSLFGVKPKIFMNTEMIYNNLIASTVENLGYRAIFAEGVERVLGWRSPNYVYARGPVKDHDMKLEKRIRVLLRNYRLSDDIGYRFSAKNWSEWPLTAEKYAIWLSSTPGQCINVFLDFETFGEHHPDESGIFYFLKALPWKVFDWQNLEFATPSEVVKMCNPVGEIDVHEMNTTSWADMERDTSAWLGNSMQRMAFEELKNLESLVKQNGKQYLKFWRLLQQSDHLYYMCTKWWNDGDVHRYFSPFSTPHDGFINLISGISEIKVRIAKELGKLEAINMKKVTKQRKSEKTKKSKRAKIKRVKMVKDKVKRNEKLKSKETIKPKSEIDFLLEQDVLYPDTIISMNALSKISNGLRKRTE